MGRGETRRRFPPDMYPEQTPADILLRISLVEGFTAAHLRQLAKVREGAPDRPEDASPRRRLLLQQGMEAALSPEGAEDARKVRKACDRIGARIVTLGSDGYPPLLAALPDAPLVLFWWGSLPAGRDPVAVVGSRAPTAAGKEFTRGLTADLSFRGVVVVSGMARGIDTAAHEGALSATGETIAVLGCGVDVLYPPEAGRLRENILRKGAVVSEFPPGTKPLPHRFPARNRIISGMARAVVVAEAPARSGALITARCALEQGREVMAVPGSPVFPHTDGNNRLLQEGATMVTGAADVLTALGLAGRGWPKSRTPVPGEGGEGDDLAGRILGFLSAERHVNEIAVSLNIPVPELFPRLLDMEFQKLIERGRGDYYRKTSKTGPPTREGV